MLSHNLKKWKIFNILEPEFKQRIHVAVVYGDLGDNAVIATFDHKIYILGPDATKYCTNLGTNGIFYPVEAFKLTKKDVKTIACGNDYILILTTDGMVCSMRYNKCKNTYEVERSKNVCVKIHLNIGCILDIACGYDYFVALTNHGKVYMWNINSNVPNDFKQVNVTLNNKIITSISCGKNFSIVITDTGEVYSWGTNSVGQLGINSRKDVDRPDKITALDGVVIEKVVCGYSHTLALSTTGVLYVWGGNSCGQLGLNTTANSFVPVELKEMKKVRDIAACSACHISAAVAESNEVFIWGKCMEQCILVPTCTTLKCLHDVFAYYAWPRVTYQPLIFYDERNSNLVNSLAEAYDNPETSDLVFEVQEESIRVHKAILKIRCQHLRTMFQDVWAESRQNLIKNEQFSFDVYVIFLYYLYTDKISPNASSQIVELLSLAEMYNMSQLKSLCAQILIKELTIQNIVSLYNISVKYNIKELEKHCFMFAINHMTEVVQNPDFIELDKDVLQNFLIQAAEAGVFKT